MDSQRSWESLLTLINSRMWRNLRKQSRGSSIVSGQKYMMGQNCSIYLVLIMGSKCFQLCCSFWIVQYCFVKINIASIRYYEADYSLSWSLLFWMNRYSTTEIKNLARFISVMKFHPLSWRTSHPYVLVDRFEDVTPPERVHMNNKCDRNVTLYGYLRGCNLKKETKVFSFLHFFSLNCGV